MALLSDVRQNEINSSREEDILHSIPIMQLANVRNAQEKISNKWKPNKNVIVVLIWSIIGLYPLSNPRKTALLTSFKAVEYAVDINSIINKWINFYRYNIDSCYFNRN